MPNIVIRELEGTWVVRGGGAVLGETTHALEVTRGSHAPDIYFPRENIAMAFFEPGEKRDTCPHRGPAQYYTLHTKSTEIPEAAWSHDTPGPEFARVRDHIAFDRDKLTVERL